MNLISIYPHIRATQCRMMTENEEIQLRNSEKVRQSVDAVRNGGEKDLKKVCYYRVPNAIIIGGQNVGQRRNSYLTYNNKVMLDYDFKGQWDKLWKKVRGYEEQLGILHFERSASLGAHVTVRRVEGLSIEETICYYEYLLQDEFDHLHDLARAAFLVPMDDVLYCHPDYYATTVATQMPMVSTEEMECIRQMVRKPMVKQSVKRRIKTKAEEPEPLALTDMKPLCAGYRSRYSDNSLELKYLIEQIEEKQLDITNHEPAWWQIACVTANVLGEEGRDWFHRISRFYPNYSVEETDQKFSRALKGGYNYNMGTFISIFSKYNEQI